MNEPPRAQSIVGDGKNREENDFYPTPAYAVQALLDREQFSKQVYEPACGAGNISQVLIHNGYDVYSTDLIDRGYGIGGVDFLQQTVPHGDIITNPPFKFSLQFINHAKTLAPKKIALLLKTVFLEGVGRYDMFQDKDFPLQTVYVFCKRLTMTKNGEPSKNGGMISFSWFVWNRDYEGEPVIRWIK